MKNWIITVIIFITPALQAQTPFGAIEPGCFRVVVDIEGQKFTDYLHFIDSTGVGIGPNEGTVTARLIVPVAKAASTSTSEFRFHPWGNVYSFNMPFAIYEKGRLLEITLQGTYQIPFTSEEDAHFNGHFDFKGDETYVFTAHKISDSAKECGPEFDL